MFKHWVFFLKLFLLIWIFLINTSSNWLKCHLDLCQWHMWSFWQVIIECFYIPLYQGLYTLVNLVSLDFLERLNVHWDFSQVCEWCLYPIQEDSWTMTQFKNLCFNLKFCLWWYAYWNLEESRIFYMIMIIFSLLRRYSEDFS